MKKYFVLILAIFMLFVSCSQEDKNETLVNGQKLGTTFNLTSNSSIKITNMSDEALYLLQMDQDSFNKSTGSQLSQSSAKGVEEEKSKIVYDENTYNNLILPNGGSSEFYGRDIKIGNEQFENGKATIIGLRQLENNINLPNTLKYKVAEYKKDDKFQKTDTDYYAFAGYGTYDLNKYNNIDKNNIRVVLTKSGSVNCSTKNPIVTSDKDNFYSKKKEDVLTTFSVPANTRFVNVFLSYETYKDSNNDYAVIGGNFTRGVYITSPKTIGLDSAVTLTDPVSSLLIDSENFDKDKYYVVELTYTDSIYTNMDTLGGVEPRTSENGYSVNEFVPYYKNSKNGKTTFCAFIGKITEDVLFDVYFKSKSDNSICTTMPESAEIKIREYDASKTENAENRNSVQIISCTDLPSGKIVCTYTNFTPYMLPCYFDNPDGDKIQINVELRYKNGDDWTEVTHSQCNDWKDYGVLSVTNHVKDKFSRGQSSTERNIANFPYAPDKPDPFIDACVFKAKSSNNYIPLELSITVSEVSE